MVVDRGGLRYPIEVVDQFSTNLRRFQSEIRASREEFLRFRRDARRLTQGSTQAEAQARRAQAQATRDEARAERERIRNLQARVAQQARQERELGRITRQARAESERRARAEERAAAAQARSNRQAAVAANRAAEGQVRLRREIGQTESAASRLLFTFRRLVGVLALFTVARQVTGAFTGLVRSGFEFNQTLERSRLGIAGILTAVTNVRNEQGELVQGAEAFALAQGEARRQQELLRQDALATTATFQELLDVFQVALGPGIAAGLNIDQVRQLSVLVSQAASNIGLQQNQLSEEIRAILTGNIRATTTRLAQVLNLTNEEIRRLQALGPDVFFQNITERLQGFALGAQAAATTVGGLFVRLKDVLELVAGNAAEDAFESLRDTFQGLFDTLTVREEVTLGGRTFEVLRPDPEIQAAFEAIFDAIENVLLRARELGATIGLDGLANSAQLLATALEVVGTLLVDIVAGAIRGFSTLQTIFNPIIQFFGGLSDALPVGTANELVATFVQLATVIFGLRVAFGGFIGLFGRAIALFTSLPVQLGRALLRVNNLVEGMRLFVGESKAAQVVLRTFGPLLALGGAITALVFGFKEVASSILGIRVELKDLPEVVGIAFERFFGNLIATFGTLSTIVSVRTRQTFNTLLAEARIGVRRIKNFFDLELGSSEDRLRLEQSLRDREDAQERTKAAQENLALELEISEAKARQKQIEEDADRRAGERINKLREEVRRRQEAARVQRELAEREARAGQEGGGAFEPREQDRPDFRPDPRIAARLAARRSELELARRLFEIEQSAASADERSVQSEQAKLEALRERARLQQEAFEAQAVELELQINEAGVDERPQLQAQLNALKEEQLLSEGEIALKIAEQEAALRRAKLVAEGTLNDGFGQGLSDFANQFSSQFLAGIEIARGALNRFSAFVSDSIVKAFDPNTPGKDLKESFARFLQDIARLILQQLIQLAIARALISAGFGGPAGGAGASLLGGGLGRQKGGPIPQRHPRAQPSLAHYMRPQGLARGGQPRPPRGVDRRDTLPIWAQPGEFMQPVSAVKKYGVQVMEAIRQGAIDPTALRSLAGSRRLAARLRSTGPGYQTGGEITAARQGVAEAGGANAAAPANAGGQVTGLLVASEQQADTILAGGRQALLDLIEEQGPDIEERLARFRS